MAKNDGARASYLTVPQQYTLIAVVSSMPRWGFGTFHVGSSLDRPDFHDVDLRCMLEDAEFDAMFRTPRDGEHRLQFLNAAISDWIAARTGLPIDFQFQRQTDANAKFTGLRNGLFAVYQSPCPAGDVQK